MTVAVLKDDQTLVLACVLAENKVMAILPLLRSAGKTGYALKHRYTPHFSLLLADVEQERVLNRLVEGLSQLSLHALLIEPVSSDDNNLHALQRVMESNGFHCDYTFRHYNWIYRVHEPSFQDYMAARPAKLRNTISRKQRKLEREHGYDIRLYIGDAVPQAMAAYYAVCKASWKANEQYVGFMDDIVTDFSRTGWSRLAILSVKGEPAAAQLWFVHHGKASIFRLFYDEAWKAYSPGSILTSYMMQYVIDTDKVEEIDFLTGNEAYKQDWMSERRECFVLSCIKPVKPAGWGERLASLWKHCLNKS